MNVELQNAMAVIASPDVSIEDRIAAGRNLAILGDPRVQTLEPLMIPIQGGAYEVGSNNQEIDFSYDEFAHLFSAFTVEETKEWFYKEYPRHTVYISQFKVSKYLVTNDNFLKFSNDTRYQINIDTSIEKSNHPVTGISHKEARLYCAWLSAKLHRNFRLLTEQEWEWLAGSGKSYRFPWGNKFDHTCANTAEMGIGDTTPVGVFLKGNSLQGVTDLAGNVEEWVDNIYMPYEGGRLIKDRIYHFNGGQYYVLRGGCYTLHGDLCISSRRHGFFPDYSITGFRIAETI